MREGIGNHLLVIRGNYRGQIGEIVEVKELGCGLIDYCLTFGNDPGIAVQIPAEDCRDYVPGSLSVYDPLNITEYLSSSTMKKVAEEIFQSKMELYVDDVIKNRRDANCGGLADQVLNKVAKKFIDENFDDISPFVVQRCEHVIKSDEPFVKDEDEKSFGRSIQWRLETVASQYIDEHKDEFIKIMKDKIVEVAKEISTKDFMDKLGYKVQKLFKEEVYKEDET